MSHRREDPSLLEWLRRLQAEVNALKRDGGMKRNNVRLGEMVVSTDPDTDGIVVDNLATGASTLIGGYAEIVFSWGGVVDETDESGPWPTPFNVLIKQVVITARVSGTDDLAITVYGVPFVLLAGQTLSVQNCGIEVPDIASVTVAVTDVGDADVEELVVTLRYVRGGTGTPYTGPASNPLI